MSEPFTAMMPQGAFSWSADGTRVAYAMGPEDAQNSALFVTDVRGGATTRLTELDAWRSDVSFSPDGTSIAFSATERPYDYDADRDLYTMRINTRQVKRVTNTDNRKEYRPVWSPDGGWLAYDRAPANETVPTKPSVRRIAVDGSGDRPLDVNGRVQGWVR